MNTRLITSEDELILLRDSWNYLVRANDETNVPFFSWEWFYRSWLHFGKPTGQGLAVVVVEDGDQLVGLLPLVYDKKTSTGITYRVLGFCNTGIIPRNTAYWLPERDNVAIFQAILQQIFSVRQTWDVLELTNISQGTFFHDFCLLEHSGMALIQTKGLSSPYALLEGLTYDQYFAQYVNKDARRRIKSNTTRFAAENKCWEMNIFEAEKDIQLGIDLMLAVRKQSWKGDFSNEAYVWFYREILSELVQSYEVLIPVLMLDGLPIAAEVITGCNGNYFFHTNDYDLRFRETAPGICLLHAILIVAFERGWRLCDFTGDDYDYKKNSSTGTQQHSTFQIFHNNIKSRLIYFAKTSVLPLIRKVLRKPDPNDFISAIKRF